MPKPPITISIVPSSLALFCHVALAVMVSALLLIHASPWHALLAGALLAGVILAWQRGQGAWQLRRVSEEGETQWQWRGAQAQPWSPVTLRTIYLGPGLIGLRLGRRLHWLWPDSAEAGALWELRRELVRRRTSDGAPG